MALIVEDGTGKAGAESYISVADADTYHASRGHASWAGTDAVKETALRNATDYMESVYTWQGDRVTSTQALGWPRVNVIAFGFDVASTVVPLRVSSACAELGLRALSGELLPDVGRQARREQVGPIEIEYEPGSSPVPRYNPVDAMLRPYTTGGSMRAIRA